MTTKPTERDLVEEVEELLAKATPGPWEIEPVFISQQSGGACHFGEYRFPFQVEDGHSKTYPRETADANARLMTRSPELLRRMVERDKRNRQALKLMVDLWDAEHPDDPCGCVGASDDCKYPPTCELCVARMVMEGRDPSAE